MSTQLKYGNTWPADASAVEIERSCIRKGGKWIGKKTGKEYGAGLFTHYRNLETLLWPEDDHHRWSDLQLQNIIDNRITVIGGARDSGKTWGASKWALCDYWCFPQETLFLMTSTTMQGLEQRIWGTIKKLVRAARERYPQLEGSVVDAKHGLFTDDISGDAEIRDMNKGIIGIPLLSSQDEFMGMALKNFAGIKQVRRRLLGDELQFIHVDYLKVLDAMDKGDFKAILLGNMIANNGKALDRVSEPVEGWANQKEPTKTSVWKNKYHGITVNLVGTDSPNFDASTRNAYPYLIDQKDVDTVAARPGGKDSVEWWSLIMGIRKAGAISDRVLTVELVNANNGFKDVLWETEPTLKIYGIDAGFGGDACVSTYIECGTEVGGREVMKFVEQKVIPVTVSGGTTAEDQIATYVRADCAMLGVPDSNVFVECGMRATLAVSFGRIMTPAINAINFGGPATQRPVSNDLFVFDERTQERRLKTCYEHYSKFVSELAFNVRAVVESGQARTFPMRSAEEFQKRETRFVYGDRHEIETKSEYKARNGSESPNYSDSTMVAVEGARRLGFVIERLAEGGGSSQDDWLALEIDTYSTTQKKYELNYGV